MMKITNRVSQADIYTEVIAAKSFWSRLKGLIGTKDLDGKAFYIPRCNWVHTFFMSMPIDVVYLDRKYRVRKIDYNLKPGRLARPVFSASSVIEISAGDAKRKNINMGDQLNVGS